MKAIRLMSVECGRRRGDFIYTRFSYIHADELSPRTGESLCKSSPTCASDRPFDSGEIELTIRRSIVERPKNLCVWSASIMSMHIYAF